MTDAPTKETQSHTPGPWQACKDGACTCGQVWSIPGDMPVFSALENGKRQIVGLACNEWGDAPDLIYGAVGKEQQVANARLIAAAPDLLAALKELHDRCVQVKEALREGILPGEAVHPLSAALTWPLSTATMAIKKAEGRS